MAFILEVMQARSRLRHQKIIEDKVKIQQVLSKYEDQVMFDILKMDDKAERARLAIKVVKPRKKRTKKLKTKKEIDWGKIRLAAMKR
jgi:methionine-rich copper-binding protein CopC